MKCIGKMDALSTLARLAWNQTYEMHWENRDRHYFPARDGHYFPATALPTAEELMPHRRPICL